MDIETIMLRNGFTKNEIEVYQYVLRHGDVNGIEVSQNLRMDKTSVYRALGSLEKKGILASTGGTYDKRFFVEDVNALKKFLEKRKFDIDHQLQGVDTFLQSISESMKRDFARTNVKVYQGENAVIRVYEERTNGNPKLIREVISEPIMHSISMATDDFWKKIVQNRLDKGIQLHLLVDHNDTDLEFHRTDPKQRKEVRRATEDFIIDSCINIYETKIAIYNPQAMHIMAVVIDDATISSLMINFFDFVWRRSEEI